MTQTLSIAEVPVTEIPGFQLDIRCSDCTVSLEEVLEDIRTCNDCGARGCDCILTEDPHQGDVFWCADCYPSCGCYYCTGD
jgi:hypothetical protein